MFNDERLPRRIWDRITIDPVTQCWRWTGQHIGRHREYGCVWWQGKGSQLVHRVAYSVLVGPIPDGLQIDHVQARGCRYKDCCNPEHLEPVTPRENMRRAPGTVAGRNAAKTECDHGHPFTEANTYATAGGRRCKRCRADTEARRRARRAGC